MKIPLTFQRVATLALFVIASNSSASNLPVGLILDLDADRGLTLQDGDRVAKWENQITQFPAKDFIKRDQGRKETGSGRPTLKKEVRELNGHHALVFLQQELTCLNEDAFDSLSQGGGSTWFCVLAVHAQRVGLEDVNSFFGNLRNDNNYEGIWGCFKDDNTLWWGARNGLTFGRFDRNNPQVIGPKLTTGQFVVVAGRMDAGTPTAQLDLFLNHLPAYSSEEIPVNPKANPSCLSIGQERDAINHPGHESFDGEIARFLIWPRPLSDSEMIITFNSLATLYGLTKAKDSLPSTPDASPKKPDK